MSHRDPSALQLSPPLGCGHPSTAPAVVRLCVAAKTAQSLVGPPRLPRVKPPLQAFLPQQFLFVFSLYNMGSAALSQARGQLLGKSHRPANLVRQRHAITCLRSGGFDTFHLYPSGISTPALVLTRCPGFHSSLRTELHYALGSRNPLHVINTRVSSACHVPGAVPGPRAAEPLAGPVGCAGVVGGVDEK